MRPGSRRSGNTPDNFAAKPRRRSAMARRTRDHGLICGVKIVEDEIAASGAHQKHKVMLSGTDDDFAQ
jgi:hypothetical protein